MKGPWLGYCRLTEGGDELEILAAAWCTNRQGFDTSVRLMIAAQGGQFLSSHDAQPVGPFIARHPHAGGAALASEVDDFNRVALGPFRSFGKATAAPSLPVTVQKLPRVLPLGSEPDGQPLKTVPDALYAPLFGPNDPDMGPGPLKTYAILDAAKLRRLPRMLDASGLPFCCLFEGEAFAELKTVAPYIVELDENSSFTRNLFSGESGTWAIEHGLFLRSSLSLANLSRRLARFVMVRSPRGTPEYFRFWEICVLDYIGFFGGVTLGQKLFPNCVLIWNTQYFNAGRRFVLTRINAP